MSNPFLPLDTLPIIQGTAEWTAVRKAKNWQDNGFVSDVTSSDIRCNQLSPATDKVSVAAGSTVSATFNNALYHPGPFRKCSSHAMCSRISSADFQRMVATPVPLPRLDDPQPSRICSTHVQPWIDTR